MENGIHIRVCMFLNEILSLDKRTNENMNKIEQFGKLTLK